ncbi:hypothetical protein [Sinomonas gamaensis]|uniref:hypothetical protein n=1 Tax=Sinomonas gamaensis TaxID=2565624 RepID=UPI001485DD52|nr:hypothetical protein [Sinomonas gamaensis]
MAVKRYPAVPGGAARGRTFDERIDPLDDVVIDLGAGSLLGDDPDPDPEGTRRGLQALLKLARRSLEAERAKLRHERGDTTS